MSKIQTEYQSLQQRAKELGVGPRNSKLEVLRRLVDDAEKKLTRTANTSRSRSRSSSPSRNGVSNKQPSRGVVAPIVQQKEVEIVFAIFDGMGERLFYLVLPASRISEGYDRLARSLTRRGEGVSSDKLDTWFRRRGWGNFDEIGEFTVTVMPKDEYDIGGPEITGV